MKFRLFEKDDIQLYLDWVNQQEIWEVDNNGPYEHRTTESFAEQWGKIINWRRSWFIIIDDQEIGYIGFVSNQNDELTDEFFIVIGETDTWGKGYGKKAMQWLCDKALELGLNRLTGQVLGNNMRALRFYKAIGFKIIGEKDPTFIRNGQTWRTTLIEKKLS